MSNVNEETVVKYNINETRIIKKNEFFKRYPICETTLKKHITDGLMVPLVSLGDRAVGIIEQEANLVMAARVNKKSEAEIKSLVKALIEYRAKLFEVA
jgi:hypothetical protein